VLDWQHDRNAENYILSVFCAIDFLDAFESFFWRDLQTSFDFCQVSLSDFAEMKYSRASRHSLFVGT